MKNLFLLFGFIALMSYINIYNMIAQECGILNTSINIIDDSSFPNFDLSVTGDVIPIKCKKVKVKLCCESGNNPCIEHIVSVDQNTGKWEAVFEDFSCPCHGSISFFTTTVVCEDYDCGSGTDDLTYKCPTGDDCPAINTVAFSINPCENDSVSSCGYHNVNFIPFVSGTVQGYIWNFGDNSPDVNGNGTPTQISHNYYKPPIIDPKLTLINFNCTPSFVDYSIVGINFSICDNCPAESQIQINTNIDKCLLTGTIVADFCEEQYNSVLIDYGDGNDETLNNPNQLNGFVINHSYNTNDTYFFTIKLQKNGPSCTYTKEITITNCVGGDDDDDDNDDFNFCNDFWCCLLYFLLILFLVAATYALLTLICTGSGWPLFIITFGIAIGLAIWVVLVCGIGFCELLLAIGASGIISDWVVCPNVPCNAWVCSTTKIPILGIEVKNIGIVSLLLLILTLIFCNL